MAADNNMEGMQELSPSPARHKCWMYASKYVYTVP